MLEVLHQTTIPFLPPIKHNAKAERKFAQGLLERVFGRPVEPLSRGYQRPLPLAAPKAPPASPVIAFNGKRYAHRASGLNLKMGPLSRRLGGEYIPKRASEWDVIKRVETQGLTAGFFGDPPAGRSALDKKKAAGGIFPAEPEARLDFLRRSGIVREGKPRSMAARLLMRELKQSSESRVVVDCAVDDATGQVEITRYRRRDLGNSATIWRAA